MKSETNCKQTHNIDDDNCRCELQRDPSLPLHAPLYWKPAHCDVTEATPNTSVRFLATLTARRKHRSSRKDPALAGGCKQRAKTAGCQSGPSTQVKDGMVCHR